jgi:glycine betaine/proline transport system permease protein
MSQVSKTIQSPLNRSSQSRILPASWSVWVFWLVVAALIVLVPQSRDASQLPTLPVADWISDGLDFALNDIVLFGIELKDVTRALANLIDFPAELLRGALADGFEFDWGVHYVELPPLSWVGLAGLFIATSFAIGGRGLGLFAAFVALYLLVFDLWNAAALTLASVLLSVPLSVIFGLLLGIACHGSARVRTTIAPVLDLMQTVPIFAYMVPVLLLFGFGPSSAIVATMVYAIPPMVRATLVGLERVPGALTDLGCMVGASRRTTVWAILVPSARPLIMVGINQVIMNSLNMVIIASMIGAGGLGFEVLDALRKLRLGQGVEAGIAITLLAILLDRLSQTPSREGSSPATVAPWIWAGLVALTIVTSIIGYFVTALATFPSHWTVTTGPLWDSAMTWLNINAFDSLEAFKVAILTTIMFPLRDLITSAPWLLIVSVAVGLGYRLSGIKTALVIAGLLGFIAITGIWELAMITLYLCGFGVLLAFVSGATVGLLTHWFPRLRKPALLVADLLQTLPSFVYLIPVVMLFRVGDFAAVIAVAAYAIAPAIRYTIHGLINVPQGLSDVATVVGCTPWQKLKNVQLPMAVPEILLGLNQTIMMGLAMVVITALVGTNDLGQEVYIALASVDPGRGIVAGLGVAFLAMVLDRLVTGAAAEYRRKAIG